MADARRITRVLFGVMLVAACVLPQWGRRLLIARSLDVIAEAAQHSRSTISARRANPGDSPVAAGTASMIIPASWAWFVSLAGVSALVLLYIMQENRRRSPRESPATLALVATNAAISSHVTADARTTMHDFFALIAAPVLEFDAGWQCTYIAPQMPMLPAFAKARVGEHLFDLAQHCAHGDILRDMLAAIYAPTQPATIYRALASSGDSALTNICCGLSAMRFTTSGGGGAHGFWIYCHTQRA